MALVEKSNNGNGGNNNNDGNTGNGGNAGSGSQNGNGKKPQNTANKGARDRRSTTCYNVSGSDCSLSDRSVIYKKEKSKLNSKTGEQK